MAGGSVDARTGEPRRAPCPPSASCSPPWTSAATCGDRLDSLLRQDFPSIVEVLVVDGGSTDGTREVVQGEGGLVRLLDNPKVTAAAAMNVGIAALRAR
ncbi:MAG: glycosyltransferase [Acidimicrobiales bacterium]